MLLLLDLRYAKKMSNFFCCLFIIIPLYMWRTKKNLTSAIEGSGNSLIDFLTPKQNKKLKKNPEKHFHFIGKFLITRIFSIKRNKATKKREFIKYIKIARLMRKNLQTNYLCVNRYLTILP